MKTATHIAMQLVAKYLAPAQHACTIVESPHQHEPAPATTACGQRNSRDAAAVRMCTHREPPRLLTFNGSVAGERRCGGLMGAAITHTDRAFIKRRVNQTGKLLLSSAGWWALHANPGRNYDALTGTIAKAVSPSRRAPTPLMASVMTWRLFSA